MVELQCQAGVGCLVEVKLVSRLARKRSSGSGVRNELWRVETNGEEVSCRQ